jgi:hypothetical protein
MKEREVKLARRDWLKFGAMAGASLLPRVSNAAGASGRASGADSAEPQQKWGNGVDPGQTLPPEARNGPWRNLRAVKEQKVFDVHCHACGPLSGHKEWQDNTNELIAAMDFYGTAQAAMNPSHGPYETIVERDVVPHLDRLIRVTGLPTIATNGKQLTPDIVAEQCTAALERDGCKMVGESMGDALLSLQSRYSPSELKPIMDVVRKYDVPVQTHTGWSAGNPHRNWPDYMGALLAAYPDVKFIMGHTGGPLAVPDGWEALRLLFSYKNAYVDTSTSPLEIISEAVKGVGAERVMFGSDFYHPELEEGGPFHLRAVYTHWWNLNNIANADLTEDQRAWILYKSARKLLKLPEA